jgi:hypothetical protein
MISISPSTIGDIGKRILSNISNYVLDNRSIANNNNNNNDDDNDNTMTSLFLHGNFTLLPDEPHADLEIGSDTRVKVRITMRHTRHLEIFFLA